MLSDASHVVGVIGVLVILWGVGVTIVSMARVEYHALRHPRAVRDKLLLRQHLGSSLLLGLEFLIAADIIRTVVQPTLEEVAVLGGIVAIRTVISHFLQQELASEKSPPLG
ncbi:MAG: DUF1622 domain-containing protein [Dehalococcoidia bacterium]|nr:DUF1622 domain-containing protein [Dehalococcoidia bacterium]